MPPGNQRTLVLIKADWLTQPVLSVRYGESRSSALRQSEEPERARVDLKHSALNFVGHGAWFCWRKAPLCARNQITR